MSEPVWEVRCHNCGLPIVYDVDSGYWIHRGYGKVDGANGLYCSPEMWDEPEKRVYAHPAGVDEATRMAALLSGECDHLTVRAFLQHFPLDGTSSA